MVSIEVAVAMAIAGVGTGIALHRFIMALVLWEDPDTKCAYCKWLHKDKCRHGK